MSGGFAFKKTIKDKEKPDQRLFSNPKVLILTLRSTKNDKVAVGNMTKEQYEEMQKKHRRLYEKMLKAT